MHYGSVCKVSHLVEEWRSKCAEERSSKGRSSEAKTAKPRASARESFAYMGRAGACARGVVGPMGECMVGAVISAGGGLGFGILKKVKAMEEVKAS